jgi:uncharacterized protein YndB with AHSA1/START domain
VHDARPLIVTTPSDREIMLIRTFDAPRDLVFDALTKPELLKQWFGSRGQSLVVCDVDLRAGGSCHLVLRGPDGSTMGMHGVYREIVRPERIVRTESFDNWPMVESIVTCIEQDGKTTMTATIIYPSRQVRDADVAAGLEHDATESYDKLAECLACL